MPIENVIEQDAIADSILGDDSNIVGYIPHEGALADEDSFMLPASESEEAQEQAEEEAAQGTEELAELGEYVQQAQQPEQTQPQPEPPTYEQCQQFNSELGETVRQLGLVDELGTSKFVAALGADNVDLAAVGEDLTKLAVNAVQLYGAGATPETLGEIPQPLADAFTRGFIKNVLQEDPRSRPADAQSFSQYCVRANLNLAGTVDQTGLDASADIVNSPEAATFFVNGAARALGYQVQIPPEVCMRVADAYYENVFRPILQKLNQPDLVNAAEESRRQRSSQPPMFRTNNDIYDSEGLELYRQNHGRL